ncbi:MAG: type 4b pilus protein PilO2 [Pseudomonadota bacterium]|jgi:hypothetical protein
MPAPQTFELERGRIFVAGLFWQPLPGTLRDRKKETLRLAKELNFDLAVWRTSGVLHVGFANTSAGVKPGWLSAAAVVSKTLEMESPARSFLCATEIKGGRWLYVAQREGVILPDGDFVGSEDEVRSRMLTDGSIDHWPLIVAPAHWGIPGAVERSFEDFLPKKAGKNDFKRWWGLVPIKSKPSKKLLPVALAAAVLVGALLGYRHWQRSEEARRLALVAEQTQTSAPQPVKLEHPWKKEPKAEQYLKECMNAFGRVESLWPGNWTPREATCDGASFTVVWTRGETGWIEHLRTVVPDAVLSKDGSLASLTAALALSPGGDDPVPTENERTLAMHAVGQKYGFKVSLAPAQTAPTLPGDTAAGTPIKDWAELAWSVQGIQIPPSVVLAAIDGPGLRVKKIQAVFSGGIMNWNMEGIQYVQP